MQLDFLQTIWCGIVITLILAIRLRKLILKGQGNMQQRSLESGTTLDEYFFPIISLSAKCIGIAVVSYVMLLFMSNYVIQIFLNWYTRIYIAVLLPTVLTWINKNVIVGFNYTNLVQLAIMTSLNIVNEILDISTVKQIGAHRTILNIWIVICIVSFFSLLFDMRDKRKKNFYKRLPKSGIRKDLYCRTSKLDVDVSSTKLARYCERYFDTYLKIYQKLKRLCSVEYVTLEGAAIKIWYRRVARVIRWAIDGSLFIILIECIQGMWGSAFETFLIILAFRGVVFIYKLCNLQQLLYTITIRTAYDVWGYYLVSEKGEKFVGTVQMIDRTKYHRYVHAFLDIAALCRAVAAQDEATKKCDICIIAQNMRELFVGYTDYEENPQWTMVIPLWIATLFEFKVTKEIHMDEKKVLIKCCKKNTWPNIEIFLQSFWADMEKKDLQNGIADFIQEFKTELFNVM